MRLTLNNSGRTDMEEEAALSHAKDIVDVYSNSWGPSGSGRDVSGPGNLTKLALEMGVSEVGEINITYSYTEHH